MGDNGSAKRVANAHLEAWRTVCWASENSRICTKHPFAVEWLASQRESISWITKTVHEASMGRWRQSVQGDNCDGAGLAELRQAVIRLRMAEAQPTNPDDKKHLLLKTGEIKWCWKCGARVERDSAPRLLLKTACSGAPRTKEYERALSLLGKGQHPKSFVFVEHPSPISDKEWDQWHQDHGNLFFCLRELSSS